MVKLLVLLTFLSPSCSSVRSRYHVVRSGDSLWKIGKKYGLTASQIKNYNDADRVAVLMPGQKVYIPFEKRKGSVTRNGKWGGSKAQGLKALRGFPRERRPAAIRFTWPVHGRVSSHYGRRRGRPHEGIDIVAYKGTPVKAARAGRVTYTGNRLRGYGNLVIVRHLGGYTSAYAHLDKIKVKRGQYLSRGEVLGLVGSTGRATSAHLHFEIRSNHVPVNPLLYLQGDYAANTVSR